MFPVPPAHVYIYIYTYNFAKLTSWFETQAISQNFRSQIRGFVAFECETKQQSP